MTADDTVTAKLAEWGALTEAATPGPWVVEENDYGEHAVYLDEGEEGFGTAYIALEIRQGHDEGRADAEFIAAARAAMPALLRFVKKIRKGHEPMDWCPNPRHDAEGVCPECVVTCVKDGLEWPCPTEQAAQKWLGGEE